MWNKELECAAAHGQAMPDGLDAPSRALFLALRGLYWQYREGILDAEQAKREKALFMKDYDMAVLDEKCRQKSRELWKSLPYDIMKCECEECRNLARIILGLK